MARDLTSPTHAGTWKPVLRAQVIGPNRAPFEKWGCDDRQAASFQNIRLFAGYGGSDDGQDVRPDAGHDQDVR